MRILSKGFSTDFDNDRTNKPVFVEMRANLDNIIYRKSLKPSFYGMRRFRANGRRGRVFCIIPLRILHFLPEYPFNTVNSTSSKEKGPHRSLSWLFSDINSLKEMFILRANRDSNDDSRPVMEVEKQANNSKATARWDMVRKQVPSV